MTPYNLYNGMKCLYSDIHAIARRELDFYFAKPKSAVLFLTYRCNSKCKSCTLWRRTYSPEEIKKELDITSWKNIIDKLLDKDIKVFELLGGNVLTRKNVLIPIMKYLYEKGAVIHIATNQIGLDAKIAQAMVQCVNTVYISTDGVGDMQEKIRGIAKSSELGRNAMQKLLHYRGTLENNPNKIRLVCNCTVSKLNIDLLESIADYAAEMCFDEVHFEYIGEFKRSDVEKSRIGTVVPEPYFIEQEKSLLANEEEALKIKNKLVAIRKKYKDKPIKIVTTNIDLLSHENMHLGTIPHDKCYVERNLVTVDPYGNLIPCPFIQNYTYGNLQEKNFLEIWNQSAHRKMRMSQNNGNMPMCRQCIIGVVHNIGILKSMQKVYIQRIRPKISY